MRTNLRRTVALAAQALAVVAIGAAPSLSLAQPQSTLPAAMITNVGDPRLEVLERWFWMCDYIATTRGASPTAMAECYVLTEDFKNAKFGGDFHELLKYWKLNKPAEHDRIQQSERTP